MKAKPAAMKKAPAMKKAVEKATPAAAPAAPAMKAAKKATF